MPLPSVVIILSGWNWTPCKFKFTWLLDRSNIKIQFSNFFYQMNLNQVENKKGDKGGYIKEKVSQTETWFLAICQTNMQKRRYVS